MVYIDFNGEKEGAEVNVTEWLMALKKACRMMNEDQRGVACNFLKLAIKARPEGITKREAVFLANSESNGWTVSVDMYAEKVAIAVRPMGADYIRGGKVWMDAPNYMSSEMAK